MTYILLASAFTGPLILQLPGKELFPSTHFTEELKNVLFSFESPSDWTDLLHPTCYGTEYQRTVSELHSLKDLMLLL